MISKQQDIVRKATRRARRSKARCYDSDRVCYVDVEVDETDTVFEVDLKATAGKIKEKIDEQVQRYKRILARVVQIQVNVDFASAKKQISEYMDKFQIELEMILSERDRKQAEAPRLIELLTGNRTQLEELLRISESSKS